MIKEEEEAEQEEEDENFGSPDQEKSPYYGQRNTKSTLKSDKSGASKDTDHAQNQLAVPQ